MIYAFGNSHSHFFTDSRPGEIEWGSKKNEYFTSYSGNFQNPDYKHVLAHKFDSRFFPYFLSKIEQIKFNENDYIMFVVGEIDCRWHIPKKVINDNRSIDDVVNEEMDYLFSSFLFLKEHNYKVIGWGGHPSTTKGHNDDVNNPIYSNCLLRNEISLKWNDMLKQKCVENQIPFLSIINELINPDGLTNMSYFLDDYHLNQSAYPIVINKLKELNLI